MSNRPRYHVEWMAGGQWARVIGSEDNRSFATGYYYGMQQFRPHPALRVVDDTGRVVEHCAERGPHAGQHLN